MNVVEKEPMWRPSDLFDAKLAELDQRPTIPEMFEAYRALTFDSKAYRAALATQNEFLDP
jgi:hypothetical protein